MSTEICFCHLPVFLQQYFLSDSAGGSRELSQCEASPSPPVYRNQNNAMREVQESSAALIEEVYWELLNLHFTAELGIFHVPMFHVLNTGELCYFPD